MKINEDLNHKIDHSVQSFVERWLASSLFSVNVAGSIGHTFDCRSSETVRCSSSVEQSRALRRIWCTMLAGGRVSTTWWPGGASENSSVRADQKISFRFRADWQTSHGTAITSSPAEDLHLGCEVNDLFTRCEIGTRGIGKTRGTKCCVLLRVVAHRAMFAKRFFFFL